MGKIKVDPQLCKGCGLCIHICPLSLLQMSQEYNNKGLRYVNQAHEEKCIGCMLCAIQCPDAAIEVYKEEA